RTTSGSVRTTSKPLIGTYSLIGDALPWRSRVRQEQVFVMDIRDPRQRPDFAVRESSFGERLRDRRQRAQRMRGAHLLPRRRKRNLAAIREPLGAALERPLPPAEPIVELAHEHEHAVALGAHLPHEAADRRIELVD